METSTKKSKLLAALEALRQDFETLVIREIHAHPEWPYWKVGETVGMSESSVMKIAQKNNITRPAGPRPQKANPEEGGL